MEHGVSIIILKQRFNLIPKFRGKIHSKQKDERMLTWSLNINGIVHHRKVESVRLFMHKHEGGRKSCPGFPFEESSGWQLTICKKFLMKEVV